MSSNVKISDSEFRTIYETNAILILKGGYEITTDQKITAFRCENDITVFAAQREKEKVISIMAWRFSANTKESVVDMQLKFHELIEPDANCTLHIVGGMGGALVGEDKLLVRIREAIDGYFKKPNLKVERRENLSHKYKNKYVTAKLDMSGKLTDCYHN